VSTQGDVIVQLESAEATDDATFELTEQLRQEVLQLPIEQAMHQAAGPAPAGSRGIDAAALGEIVVTLGTAAGGLTALVQTARRWLATASGVRKIRMELDGDVLEMSGADSEEQKRLINSWIDRHQKAKPAKDRR
jgi:hypothetical protein